MAYQPEGHRHPPPVAFALAHTKPTLYSFPRKSPAGPPVLGEASSERPGEAHPPRALISRRTVSGPAPDSGSRTGTLREPTACGTKLTCAVEHRAAALDSHTRR